MSKQGLLQLMQLVINKIEFIIERIPETLRYTFSKEKVMLNVSMKVEKGKVAHQNLGDELNYYFVKAATNKTIFNRPCTLIRRSENFMMIGSIIEDLINRNSVIWGSGAMYGGDMKLPSKPKKVLAVRGPLTREYLLSQGVDCPEVYGDPALLLPYFYAPQVVKKYKLGVIPHYVDFDNECLSELKQDGEVKIIHLSGYEDWRQVIDEICQCEFVVSSSLHGLIISDAYGIPNKWIKLSENINGGYFKYHDYFLSVGREKSEPLIINEKVSKDYLLEYKSQYIPINWSPEKLLEVAPFKFVHLSK